MMKMLEKERMFNEMRNFNIDLIVNTQGAN